MKHNIKIIYLLCFLTCWSVNSMHFNINNIKIHGLNNYSEKFVLKCLSQNDNFKSEDIFNNLNSLNLFNTIKISIRDTNLNIFVTEKPRIIKIQVIGDTGQEIRTLLLGLNFFNGNLLNYSNLKIFRKGIKIFCYKHSFFDFYLNINLSIHKKDNTVIINIKYFRNKQFVFNEVIFTGSKKIFNKKKLTSFFLSNNVLINLFYNNFYDHTNFIKSIKNLRNCYNDHGYMEFKILSVKFLLNNKKRTVTPVLNLEPGEKFLINRITFNFDGTEWFSDSEMFAIINKDIKINDIISNTLCNNVTKKLSIFCNSKNMFSAICSFTTTKLNNNRVNIIFSVTSPAKLIKIRAIKFLGITDDLKQIYRKFISQKEGDYLSLPLMNQARKLMIKKGYASEVEVIYDKSITQYTDVVFKIKKTQASLFSFGGSLTKANGLTLNFTLDLLNCFNSGNDLLLRMNRTKKNVDANFSYVIPRFCESNFELTYAMFIKREKNVRHLSFERRFGINRSFGATTSVLYNINSKSQITLILGFDKQFTKAATRKTVPAIIKYRNKYDTNISECVFGTVLTYNNLNETELFNHGMFHKIDIKIMMPASSILYGTLLYDFKILNKINDNFILSLAGSVAYAKKYFAGARYPYPKFFILKGEHRIRGYNNKLLGPRDAHNRPIGGNLSMSFKTSMFFTMSFFKTLNIKPAIFLDAGQVFMTDAKFVNRPKVTISRHTKIRTKPSRYKSFKKKHKGLIVREKLQKQLDVQITSDYLITQLLLHKKKLLKLNSVLPFNKYNANAIIKEHILNKQIINNLSYDNLFYQNVSDDNLNDIQNILKVKTQLIDENENENENYLINSSNNIISKFKTMHSINNLLQTELVNTKANYYDCFNIDCENYVLSLGDQDIPLLNGTYITNSVALFNENSINIDTLFLDLNLLIDNESNDLNNYFMNNEICIKDKSCDSSTINEQSDNLSNDVINDEIYIQNKLNSLNNDEIYIQDKLDSLNNDEINDINMIHHIDTISDKIKNKNDNTVYVTSDDINNIDIMTVLKMSRSLSDSNCVRFDSIYENEIRVLNADIINNDNELCNKNDISILDLTCIDDTKIKMLNEYNLLQFNNQTEFFRTDNYVKNNINEVFIDVFESTSLCDDDNINNELIKPIITFDGAARIRELIEHKFIFTIADRIPFYIPGAVEEFSRRCEQRLEDEDENDDIFLKKINKQFNVVENIEELKKIRIEEKKIRIEEKRIKRIKKAKRDALKKIKMELINQNNEIFQQNFFVKRSPNALWIILLNNNLKKSLTPVKNTRTPVFKLRKTTLKNSLTPVQNIQAPVFKLRKIMLKNSLTPVQNIQAPVFKPGKTMLQNKRVYHAKKMCVKKILPVIVVKKKRVRVPIIRFSKIVLKSNILHSKKINVKKKLIVKKLIKKKLINKKLIKKKLINKKLINKKLINKKLIKKKLINKKLINKKLINKKLIKKKLIKKKLIKKKLINKKLINKKLIKKNLIKKKLINKKLIKKKLIKKKFKRKRLRLNRFYRTGFRRCFRNKFMMGYRFKMNNLWRIYLLHQKRNHQENFLLNESRINIYNHSILKKDQTRNKKYGLMNFKTRKICIAPKLITANIFKNNYNKLFNKKLVYGHFISKKNNNKNFQFKIDDRYNKAETKYITLKKYTKVFKKNSYVKNELRKVKHKKKKKRYSTFLRLSCGISIGWTSPFSLPFEIVIAKAINPHPLDKTMPMTVSLIAHRTSKRGI